MARSRVSLAGVPKGTRKNAPGRVGSRRTKAGAKDIRCSHADHIETAVGKRVDKRCEAPATVFRRWTWYCAEHDPGNVSAPGCRHDLTSLLWGVTTCSMCGYQPEVDQ